MASGDAAHRSSVGETGDGSPRLVWKLAATVRGSPGLVGERVIVVTDDDVRSLDLSTGAVVWTHVSVVTLGLQKFSPIAANGTVVAALDSATVRLVESDGRRLQLLANAGDRLVGAAATWDGRIIEAMESGKVFVRDARGHSVLWEGDVGIGPALPVPVGDVAYFHSYRVVRALSLVNDSWLPSFSYTTEEAACGGHDAPPCPRWNPIADSAPAVDNGTLFVGSRYGSVHAFDVATRALLWSARVEGAVHAPVTAHAGRVLVGTANGTVAAFDARTGALAWSARVRGELEGGGAVAGRAFVVGSREGSLVAFDVETGERVWEFETGGSVVSAPLAAHGLLLVPASEAGFLAFALDGPVAAREVGTGAWALFALAAAALTIPRAGPSASWPRRGTTA